MSFKRDSDNKSFHEEIRKRRVNELLCEDIPEDEATLMKNGRLVCLVCSHRPIFDTLDMLFHHRTGQKHKYHLETFSAKKQELEDLKRKRLAEHYMKTGQVQKEAPESASQHKLLHHPVYNACTKRPKLKPHQRKSRLNLETELGIESASTSRDSQDSEKSESSEPELPVKTIDVDSMKDKLYKKITQTKPMVESNETKQYVNVKMNRLMNPEEKKTKGQKSKVEIGPQAMPPHMEEKREYVKQYLNAVGSGWKKDRSGQWVKDEDAEFDSDEEAPDIPLPTRQPTNT